MTEKTRNGFLVKYTDHLHEKVLHVFQVFEKIFSDFTTDEIFLSFNGGKDCTVLMHLIHSYLENRGFNECIRVFYMEPAEPFDEVEDFVAACASRYQFDIEKVKGKIKAALEEICKNKNLKAVIMGCRRTDPYCQSLSTYHSTDPGWPPLLRVNPLLDWTCKDVWEYIHLNKIPYCCLYDNGYTSLGDKTNTKQNPYLEVLDGITGTISYRPAYELLDDKLERAGRL